jgi:phosphoribosyl 1,2-cyclic phosphodiesterase
MAEVKSDFIKFLGTAGARFVMIKQLRSSGGLWVSSGGTNVLIDPGPGSLVRCSMSRPKLDPTKLDGIILTHRHLDHCGDINVMIEAMTEGGFKKRGTVFCPQDALRESVILEYAKGFPEKIEILEPGQTYAVNGFSFSTSMRHIHPVETYGLKFSIRGTSVAVLPDTKYFDGLESFYTADCLILSVVFLEPRPAIDHLSLPEAQQIIAKARPGRAVLTHFGMTMLTAKPHIQAQRLTQELGIPVQAASDGLTLSF